MKTMKMTQAPPLAIRLLERRFPADAAEALIGDLSEEFDQRVNRDGASAARRWFWRQTLRSLVARRHRADAPPTRALGGLTQDLRFGLRSLRRSPGFAATAIATLTLGIGATTAIGTAATRSLLRPLPYPNADRLVTLGHDRDGEIGNLGYETGVDWRARVSTLDGLAMIRSWQPTLTSDDGAVRLDGLRVNWNFFELLGVQPALGRGFTADDDAPSRWRVVLLSDGLWRRRFGASPSVIGRVLDFNGTKYTVAGVMPAGFEPLISERFYRRAEIWAPLGYAVGGDSSCRSCQHLKAIGRLRPGASVAEARAELAGVHAILSREHPGVYTDTPPRLDDLQTTIAAGVERPVAIVMGAVGFVLLVACANIAGLLLARATDRTQELSLRAALGASRGRIIRQLVVESAVIATLSAGLGLLVARAALNVFADRTPLTIPRLDGAAGDPWLFAIAAIVALVTLAGCAIVPAIVASRYGLESSLRESRQTSGRGALRLREWLMGAEIAAALLVVTVGGLMSRTVGHLLHVDPGFRAEGVLTAGLSLIGQRWAEDADVRVFQQDLLQRVRAIPGVTSAALAGQIPLGGDYDTWGYYVEGRPIPPDAERPSAERYSVTPDYFSTMQIPLRAGRLFTEADRFASDKVIVIGETTAREMFPNESPIGQRLHFGSEARPRVMTIVGVVGDVRHYSLATAPNQQFYTPQEQFTDSYLTLLVKTAQPDALAPAIRREVAALAPDVPLYKVERLDTIVSSSIATRTFLMWLLSGLGGVTVVLAGLGLYGVVSQAVGARRRELGIRVALGATRAGIVSLIARRGAAVFAGGTLVGVAGGIAVGYVIRAQLFDTRPVDPLTLAGAVLLLGAVAVAAHLAPIRRAIRADPRETLRAD